MSSDASPFHIQVAHADLGPMLIDLLGLELSSFSPFADLRKSYAPRSGSLSPAAREVAATPELRRAAGILARPHVRLRHRVGGGAVPVSLFTACHKGTVDADAVVVVSAGIGSAAMLQLFPSAAGFLDWWIDLLAADVASPAGNDLPDPLPLESLVYVLHAIDAFRRASYASLLAYAPTDEPSIGATEFVGSLNRSVSLRDVRWLLPAFLTLAPGLDRFLFEPRPAHLAALTECGMLEPVRDAATGGGAFRFGPTGRRLGVEFFRSWSLGIGFESAVRTQHGKRVTHRGFLAPTALANHVFWLDHDEHQEQACRVRHAALGRSRLRQVLGEMLEQAIDETREGANSKRSVGAPASPRPAPRPPEKGWASPDSSRVLPLPPPPPPPAVDRVPAPVPAPDDMPTPLARPAAAGAASAQDGATVITPPPKFCKVCGHSLYEHEPICPSCGWQH
ncbi:MAG: hypothetical protein HYZ53_04960 [Planctomycetes bacterium]|nr:hypothetical protein [Planctomycetota bacterium]